MSEIPGGTPSGRTVLIVDDDASFLQLMGRWLTDAGYDVTSFSDFHAAKEYVTAHRPDVVVSDVRLGAFNGLQLVIMAKQADPASTVIALTGFDDPVIREEAERAGAIFLVKPIHSFDLLQLLE